MTENQLWDLYQEYRIRQHKGRAVSKRESQYWQGRADMLLVVAKSLGYQTSFQPPEYSENLV